MRNLVVPLALCISFVSCTRDAGTTESESNASAEGESSATSAPTATGGESGSASSQESSADVSSSDSESAGDGDGDGETGSTESTGGDGDGDRECVTDADCKLQNDCCGCEGHSLSYEIPACPADCFVSFCDAIELTEAACLGGVCGVKKFDCDESRVLCDAPPPPCEGGTKASVENGCWTGRCVSVSACDVVDRCSDCGEGETCVTEQTQLGPRVRCMPIPESCAGTTPDCSCLAEHFCEAPFDTCFDGAGGISCSCLAC